MKSLGWIIWDWNGTLLDDVGLCAETLSRLIETRGLPPLGIDRYREIFDHPVRVIYERVGLDLERHSFDELAVEFHSRYADRVAQVLLQPDAVWALDHFAGRGVRQAILSALPHVMLTRTLAARGLTGYFECALGLENNHAVSKVENGKILLRRLGAAPARTVLIGDTTHDLESAAALGVRCLLVARGFQSRARLTQHGAEVYDDLKSAVQALT